MGSFTELLQKETGRSSGDFAQAKKYNTYKEIIHGFAEKIIIIPEPGDDPKATRAEDWFHLLSGFYYGSEQDKKTVSVRVEKYVNATLEKVRKDPDLISKALFTYWNKKLQAAVLNFLKGEALHDHSGPEGFEVVCKILERMSTMHYDVKGDITREHVENVQLLFKEKYDAHIRSELNRLTTSQEISPDDYSVLFLRIKEKNFHNDPKLVDELKESARLFLDKEIGSKKPWEEIKSIQEKLGVRNTNFLKMEVSHLPIDELIKRDYKDINSLQVHSLRLLRIEKYLVEKIKSCTTWDKLAECKQEIPDSLPYLHEQILRQAEKINANDVN